MADSTKDVQQCIQKCQQTIQQLTNMSNQETSPQVKTMLSEGAHHLKLCVEECQYSLQELQAPAMV